MKILMIIDSLGRGGKERRMLELLKALKVRKDIHVQLVIFSSNIAYPEVHDMGMPVHILERKPKKDPRIFFRFHKICKRFGPDMIHSWGTMSTIYAIPAAKRMGITLINANIADAPNNLSFSDSRFLRAKLTFPFSDVILGNSEAGLRAYKAPPAKSKCIYNGFDFRRMDNLDDADEVRNRLGIHAPRLVGMVGAFHDRKDYDTYLQAAQKVLEQRQDVNFLAIGDGPNLARCKQLVEDRFKDKIIFPGQLSGVESVINILDVGVLATNSLVHGEGISNAIVEYMIFGKPVVASDGGGTPEIVRDGENGFLVPPLSADKLAEKILYLLAQPELAREMGKKGTQHIRDNFSLKRMENQFIHLYQNLLAG